VKGVSKLVPIEVQQIAYFFSSKEVVYLATPEGKQHIINYSLETFEELIDPKIFFRLNRQVIVNFSALAAINNHFNGKLKITLNPSEPFDIYVSQERSKFFKEWFER